MICRLHEGALDICSLDGSVAARVHLGEYRHVFAAALDATGARLALTASRELQDTGMAGDGPALLLAQLSTSEVRVLREEYSAGPLWLPGGDALAFSTGTHICTLDVESGEVRTLYEYSRVSQGPTRLGVNPAGTSLSLLTYVGDDQRIGVVHIASGEGRLFSTSCFGYSWWDEETIAYSLGSGLKLLNTESGRSRTLLRDLRPLLESGALATADPGWAEAVASEGSDHEVVLLLCHGDRVYFAARATTQEQRPGLLPFLRRWEYHTLRGLFSMNRDRGDLRLDLPLTNEVVHDLVPLDGGRTFSAHVESRQPDGWLARRWVYFGEGAEQVPEGFGPLPRAGPGVLGDIPIEGERPMEAQG